MKVVKKGKLTEFNPEKIKNAIFKASEAAKELISEEKIDEMVSEIVSEIKQKSVGFYLSTQSIHDIVEKKLMHYNFFGVAKAYILYRAEKRNLKEKEKKEALRKTLNGKLTVRKRNGKIVPFDLGKLKKSIKRAGENLNSVDVDLVATETLKNVFDGISTEAIEEALILSSSCFIERDPDYSFLSARLFLQKLYKEVIGKSFSERDFAALYKRSFVEGIKAGVKKNLLDRRLLEFDLRKLSENLVVERDRLFQLIGIQTLYERYFLRVNSQRIELPQSFWMRVAIGLALNEKRKEEKAIEFYEVMSSFRFIPSTPTLFHSGLVHSQLSSCYLTTVLDDLKHIMKSLSDNAQLSKWSGGLGNDWTNVRATGALIKSTNVESQGVIPFLKIANDLTVAINRSGKRRGATCAYLENWHLDVEDFLDLRRNTGDERRRTHDMNTALWVPDEFMKRLLNDREWTLFSPEEVPELHHIYGKEFKRKYEEYEEKARAGKIRRFKLIKARSLWKKMLTRLFETGHPWIAFKDACNIRSPQSHVGIIHCSNLCTEVTLNTSENEIAVCNLGSLNLEKHVNEGKLDVELIEKTVQTAVRMLDNVIDLNFYPVQEAKTFSLKHRPVGLGLMGFQDALFKLNINFSSEEAVNFADSLMELISFNAILASCNLAKERGPYLTFSGSKWSKGIFPFDSIELLEKERGLKIDVSRKTKLNWNKLKALVKKNGMRNSNLMAIAPTATISNIAGCFPCIEPIFKNIYVKSNMSGEFTVVNSYLVSDLKKLNLWNEEMLEQLKYFDGNLSLMPSIPREIKEKYKEAFELNPLHLIKLTAARGKWIDQSQSHNIFMKGTSGKKLSDIYISAWRYGLKTTYYLRSLGASQIEKSTLDSRFGFTQKREYKTITELKEVKSIESEAFKCEACE
jgi:ribonucleoside-diphosphate reductase alpha chain